MRPLAVAAVLLSIGVAQAQNFPDSPQNMWVYDTQTEFTRCGLWPVQPHIHRGWRPYTRYEVAVSIYGNLMEMPATLDKRITGPRTTQTYTPAEDAFDDLDRMIEAFKKELLSMGADLNPLKQKSQLARQRATTLRKLDPKTNVSRADKYFPDVPENHWAYDFAQTLRKHDLLVNIPNSPFERMRNSGIPTHGEFAQTLILTIPKLATKIEARPKNESLDPDLLSVLPHLIKLFSREIRQQGADLPTLHRQITVAQRLLQNRRDVQARKVPPFKDVPAGHWAAKALTNLQKEGLIRGYPDGTFGGTSHR